MQQKNMKRPKSGVIGRPKSEVTKKKMVKLCCNVRIDEMEIVEEKLARSGISTRSNFIYMLLKDIGLFDKNDETSITINRS
jgi:hypothetical protein